MSTKVSTMITDSSLVVNYNGETHIVLKSDLTTFNNVKLALKEKRFDEIPELINKAKGIARASSGFFEVKDGEVFVEGQKVSSLLGRKISEFYDEGLPFEPLVAFAKKLNENPSFRSVQQLFAFLEKNNHPITENGNFIAYKKVTKCKDGVLRDSHSQTFVNTPGSVCKMPRNQVNENPEQTCSNGLHCASWDYAINFTGDVMLEVEVHPRDVVAVPVDYNQGKMRVCEYLVRGIVENPNENQHLVRDENTEEDPSEVKMADDVQHDVGPEPEEVECSECCGDCYVSCPDCGIDSGNEPDDSCYTCEGTGELMCECCSGSGFVVETYPDCEDTDCCSTATPKQEDDSQSSNVKTVNVNVWLSNEWKATTATLREDSHLALVKLVRGSERRASGVEEASARIDLGKQVFIDAPPEGVSRDEAKWICEESDEPLTFDDALERTYPSYGSTCQTSCFGKAPVSSSDDEEEDDDSDVWNDEEE